MATSFDATLAGLGIKRTGDSATAAANGSGGKTALGQDDFLALMTAQLKNQDPFDPVDNTQMVAQMAQFSSLAGITEMSTTLKAIAEKLGATTTSDALAWVGRTVLTEGSIAFGRASGGIEGGVEIDADASDVTVTISSTDGQVLKTIELGEQNKGTATFDWDGKTEAGEDAGSGPFVVNAVARDGSAPVTSRTLVWAPVASVSVASGEPVLTLPGIGQIDTSAVRAIG